MRLNVELALSAVRPHAQVIIDQVARRALYKCAEFSKLPKLAVSKSFQNCNEHFLGEVTSGFAIPGPGDRNDKDPASIGIDQLIFSRTVAGTNPLCERHLRFVRHGHNGRFPFHCGSRKAAPASPNCRSFHLLAALNSATLRFAHEQVNTIAVTPLSFVAHAPDA